MGTGREGLCATTPRRCCVIDTALRSRIALFYAAQVFSRLGYRILVLPDTFKGIDLLVTNPTVSHLAGVNVKSGYNYDDEGYAEFVVLNKSKDEGIREGTRWLEQKVAVSDQKYFMFVALNNDAEPTGDWWLVPSGQVQRRLKLGRTQWLGGRHVKKPRFRTDGKGRVQDKGPQLYFTNPRDDRLFRNKFTAIARTLKMPPR